MQIDFTEGRLAMKIDPSGELLHSFIVLNNLALSRFSAEDRKRIGVHTCPGGDRDSTHSGDVDYAELLPSLFELKAGNFYIALAGEKDPSRVLKIIREHQTGAAGLRWRGRSDRPAVETAEVVRDRILEAAEYIPVDHSARRTTVDFRPSATTRRPAATPHLRRFAHACRAPRSRQNTVELMAQAEEEEKLLRSVRVRTPRASCLRASAPKRELVQAKEALERKTEELAQVNRRLSLLNQLANNLILSDGPPQHLTATLNAVADELGARYVFAYFVDENDHRYPHSRIFARPR